MICAGGVLEIPEWATFRQDLSGLGSNARSTLSAIPVGMEKLRKVKVEDLRDFRVFSVLAKRSRNSFGVISRFCVGLTPGLISGASATRPKTPLSVSTCVFWSLPCQAAAVPFFPFINDCGECENRFEEFKNGFAADRLSCHHFRAYAFRLLRRSFAYNLVNLFHLQLPPSLRPAQIETLRIRLFKVGARIGETARCIRIHMASGWPYQDLFQAASLRNSS
jgi:hypothetical protein